MEVKKNAENANICLHGWGCVPWSCRCQKNQGNLQTMKNKQTKYIIRANYYYYANTFHAPKNGALRDQYGERIEFDTREQAEKYLTEKPTLTPFGYSNAMGCTENDDGSFSGVGTYHTAHGEYARPVYRIRKITVKPVIFKKMDDDLGMIYSFSADFEDYWTDDDQNAIDSGSTPSKI
jgi:hypothetical protein